MSKVLQVALRTEPVYVLEFIYERFDGLPDGDQARTIIHELMHIPKSFGGGFRFHDHVTRKNVPAMFERYCTGK